MGLTDVTEQVVEAALCAVVAAGKTGQASNISSSPENRDGMQKRLNFEVEKEKERKMERRRT